MTVYATLYAAPQPKAVILLFHQAGSGKGEYATIAPRLVKLGYTALAIDQRSGGDLFGPNQTARGVSGQPTYLDAKADLQAALDWAKPQGKPILLWGSSYSSALVFLVAAENPGAVAGLLSFSPGEYLGQADLVRRNAATLAIPVFVTSAKDADEIAAAKAIVDAVPGTGNVDAVPAIAGVHGSSTLIAARNAAGAEDNWRAVEAFLGRVAP
ncbi:MAG: alpha/beta hydrolase [Proteobacteria bacterium ST_bin14]|nr:MAG: alpha/beta hydrolase [Proteobacteria bacterium ST_bin14]